MNSCFVWIGMSLEMTNLWNVCLFPEYLWLVTCPEPAPAPLPIPLLAWVFHLDMQWASMTLLAIHHINTRNATVVGWVKPFLSAIKMQPSAHIVLVGMRVSPLSPSCAKITSLSEGGKSLSETSIFEIQWRDGVTDSGEFQGDIQVGWWRLQRQYCGWFVYLNAFVVYFMLYFQRGSRRGAGGLWLISFQTRGHKQYSSVVGQWKVLKEPVI